MTTDRELVEKVRLKLRNSNSSGTAILEQIISLVSNAVLDEVKEKIDEIEKSELWAQMGIPAECQVVYIDKFEEAIDNLRGNDE